MLISRLSRNIWVLLAAALAVQLWLIFSGMFVEQGLWDLRNAYQPWVENVLAGGRWPGIDSEWPYPYLAFVPMFLAELVAPGRLQAGWFILLVPANLLCVAHLAGWGKCPDREARSDAFTASWYLVAFLFLLGPVAVSRLESVTLLLAIFGICALLRSELGSSSLWFAASMWIKVWPAALIVAAIAAGRERRRIVVYVLAASASVLAVGLLLGGDEHLFSFITTQTGRGIQIESPAAAWWLWQIVAGAPNASVYHDKVIMTYQVKGAGVDLVSNFLGLLMVGAVVITFLLGVLASRRGVAWNRVVALTAMACTLDLIVFNKVGSPQYMMWLAAPVLLGLLARVPDWRTPTFAVLALAATTQLVYPVFYSLIIGGKAMGVLLLTLRNLGLVVLLISSTRKLTALGRGKLGQYPTSQVELD